jgi:hypothetical protein
MKQRIDQIVKSFYYLNDDISDEEYFEGVERVAEAINEFLKEIN